jgi:hypothetical protein
MRSGRHVVFSYACAVAAMPAGRVRRLEGWGRKGLEAGGRRGRGLQGGGEDGPESTARTVEARQPGYLIGRSSTAFELPLNICTWKFLLLVKNIKLCSKYTKEPFFKVLLGKIKRMCQINATHVQWTLHTINA